MHVVSYTHIYASRPFIHIKVNKQIFKDFKETKQIYMYIYIHTYSYIILRGSKSQYSMCLRVPIAMKRHHYRDNSYKRKNLIGGLLTILEA